MKIIALSFVLFFFTLDSQLNAQKLKNYADTANYLISNIELKKQDYIGKPFSILYNDLKIKPVFAISDDSNIKETFGKSIGFYFNYLYRDFSQTHVLKIGFKTYPSYEIIYPILMPGFGNSVNMKRIVELYKNRIITEIILKDYGQDDEPNSAIKKQ